MAFFLSYWKYIAAVVVVGAIVGIIYRAGGSAPRAELKAVATVGAAQNAHVAAVAVKQKEIVHEADKTAVAKFDVIDRHYPVQLRKPVARSSKVPATPAVTAIPEPAAAPTVPDTQQCTDRDSAHDAQLVLLIQQFYNDQRALINSP